MQPDLTNVCAEIRGAHRRRVFAMEQRKRADLALGSFLRVQLGWRKDLPSPERTAIALAAKSFVEFAERTVAGKPLPEQPDGYEPWASFVEGSVLARKPFADIETEATRHMERLSATLPAWLGFGSSVRGFSARGLGTIVGEAGDLALYSTHSKLWKRMGVAVIGLGDGLNDHRQGAPGSGSSKDDWIREGYSPSRRSKLFVIGDSLIKTTGPYRDVYLARKAYEIERAKALGLDVAPAAKIPKSRTREFRSDGHVHHRSQRYMEKRLLRDLWRAWRNDSRAAA